MKDDNEHQGDGLSRRSIAAVVLGTALWVVTVAYIVAKGVGA